MASNGTVTISEMGRWDTSLACMAGPYTLTAQHGLAGVFEKVVGEVVAVAIPAAATWWSGRKITTATGDDRLFFGAIAAAAGAVTIDQVVQLPGMTAEYVAAAKDAWQHLPEASHKTQAAVVPVAALAAGGVGLWWRKKIYTYAAAAAGTAKGTVVGLLQTAKSYVPTRAAVGQWWQGTPYASTVGKVTQMRNVAAASLGTVGGWAWEGVSLAGGGFIEKDHWWKHALGAVGVGSVTTLVINACDTFGAVPGVLGTGLLALWAGRWRHGLPRDQQNFVDHVAPVAAMVGAGIVNGVGNVGEYFSPKSDDKSSRAVWSEWLNTVYRGVPLYLGWLWYQHRHIPDEPDELSGVR